MTVWSVSSHVELKLSSAPAACDAATTQRPEAACLSAPPDANSIFGLEQVSSNTTRVPCGVRQQVSFELQNQDATAAGVPPLSAQRYLPL